MWFYLSRKQASGGLTAPPEPYQSVMVKDPDPLQPAPVPVSVQLPVMELPVSVPTSVSSFVPLVFDVPDVIVI